MKGSCLFRRLGLNCSILMDFFTNLLEASELWVNRLSMEGQKSLRFISVLKMNEEEKVKTEF